jgi:hypothetical protein
MPSAPANGCGSLAAVDGAAAATIAAASALTIIRPIA